MEKLNDEKERHRRASQERKKISFLSTFLIVVVVALL